MFRDSLDKIVEVYLGAVASHSFWYKEKWIEAKPLKVSPLIFRPHTCPVNCGGCCPRFSLAYLPTEEHPYLLKKTQVRVGKNFATFYVDEQKDRPGAHHCRNLREDGRCGIHGKHPFSCDFELLRVTQFPDHNVLSSRLYGRGWNMLRVDGKRGALCEMLPPTSESVAEVKRKLQRLGLWADHCSIESHVPKILQWIERGEFSSPLILGKET